jgi:hypothetical protein
MMLIVIARGRVFVILVKFMVGHQHGTKSIAESFCCTDNFDSQMRESLIQNKRAC